MPCTCNSWIQYTQTHSEHAGSKRLNGVWLKSWLLFEIQVLWKNVYLKKKREKKQRSAALLGPWGFIHWDCICRKHISRAREICVWLIFPFMWSTEQPSWRWTVCCSFGWMKEKKHTFMRFLIHSFESKRKWRVLLPFPPSSFHLFPWPSISSFPVSRGATHCSLHSGAWLSLAVDNMLQTDCPLCSSSLLYILLLQSAY